MVLTLTNQSSHLGELLYPHWSPLGFKFFFLKSYLILGQASPSLLYGIAPGSSRPIGMQGVAQLL